MQTRHQETRAYQNSCFELAAAMLMQKGSEQVSPCVFFFLIIYFIFALLGLHCCEGFLWLQRAGATLQL